ncbi:glutamyl-tRNA reductase [Caldalkalibacillus thermarum]|uniref:glutamyl-tRNA reductase n=1 Tax=Caldalkalibacillus thermarum TaxID=296745 RepID=UPI001667AC31|nr:glutamyl-tRNA reductase [Caldalkalibacillus thermarum]
MHLLTVSLNYKRAPVELRERFTLTKEEIPLALDQLQKTKSILECVLLSTCNRTEVFAVVDQLHRGRDFVTKFLGEWFHIERSEFMPYLDFKEDDQAIEHLFRLAVGLDSMVIGETQILGQVKEAFFAAQQAGATGTIFNTLFKQVITLAKRAHSETQIGRHAVSVSYAAVELSRKIYGHLNRKTALIIGAGKMSELTAKHLADNGVTDILVANRTLERAEGLAAKFGGRVLAFDQLGDALCEADIIISSTGAKGYILTRQDVEAAMERRPARPLFMIDIAVPRDLDPAINDIENVFLYDIDDLNGIVEANLREREKEAEKVQVMIQAEMEAFKQWVATLGVVPLITALRQKATAIQEEAMRRIENKLPDLTEEELRVIRKHTKSIINQMMHDPIVRLKEMAAEADAKRSLELFTKIFALEDELEEQEKIEQARKLAENLDKQQKGYKEGPPKELPLQL